MSVFLIDYENLHTSAFAGLEALTEEDRVIIFYTSNSDNLTFSLMQRLVKAEAKIDYLRVASGGKNSLDFQLCSYLGYLIGVSSDTRFCIVSRDKGIATMLSFWNERTENNNFVVCCPNIRLGQRVALPENGEAEITEEAAEEVIAEETAPEAAPVEEAPAPEPAAEEAETVTEQPAEPAAAEEQPAEPAPPEEQPVEKPKRKYNRRTPYKRKPKTPEEQPA